MGQACCFPSSVLAFKKNHQNLVTYLNLTKDTLNPNSHPLYLVVGRAALHPSETCTALQKQHRADSVPSSKGAKRQGGSLCSSTCKHHRTLFVPWLTSALTTLKDINSTACSERFILLSCISPCCPASSIPAFLLLQQEFLNSVTYKSTNNEKPIWVSNEPYSTFWVG